MSFSVARGRSTDDRRDCAVRLDVWRRDNASERRPIRSRHRAPRGLAGLLIGNAERGGEQTLVRARLHEMSEEAPQSLLPPLGEHRPTRADNVPAESEGTVAPLLLRPEDRAGEAAVEAAQAAPAALPLAPADPEAAPPAVPHQSLRHSAWTLAAFGAHALVLLALVSIPATEFGDGGDALEAISVSIIPASALDSRQPITDPSASASPTNVAPSPGEESAASEAAPEKAAPPEPKIEQPAIETPEPSKQLAAPAEAAPEAVKEEAPTVTSAPAPPEETKVAAVEPPPTPPPEKTPEEKPREEPPAESSPAAAAAGGATSRGTEADQPPRAAAAAASRGQVNAYGMAVQSALLAVDQREAKARASASQAKGTVVVKLALDAKGALVSAEVVKSSGRPQLDDAALMLIRLASFPPPPPGLTAAERSYLAPIRFR